MTDVPAEPYVLDIGCGPGEQTIELARLTKGRIIALDNHQPFLDKLMDYAKSSGVEQHIEPKCQSMLEMDFANGTFDIIWSEGALYFMGFFNGLKKCKKLLKNKGYLAVTELVYLSGEPCEPVRNFFEENYPDIKDVHGKLEDVELSGLLLLGNFTLPKSAWLVNYYKPMEKEINLLKQKYKGNEVALSTLKGCSDEIGFYKKYSDEYGYEFFIMRNDK